MHARIRQSDLPASSRSASIRATSPLSRRHHRGATILSAPAPPLFALAELTADLAPAEQDGAAAVLLFDLDDPESGYAAGSTAVAPLVDANLGLLLAGERRLCFFDPAAGGYVPLPGVQVHLAVAEETIAAGGSGFVTVYQVSEGDEAPTSRSLLAHDWRGVETELGTRVFVFHHQQSRRWYLLAGACCHDPLAVYQQLDEVLETYGLAVCHGPFDLTNFSSDDTAGEVAWSAPSDAAASDDSHAQTANLYSETTTEYLKGLQLTGYSPSAGFVPKVVYVMIERSDSLASGLVVDEEVELVIGGAIQAAGAAVAVPWSGGDQVRTYRFTPALTRAESLAADFGVVVRAAYQGSSSLEEWIDQSDWSSETLSADYAALLGPDTTTSGPPAFDVSASGGGNPGTAVQFDSTVEDDEATWVYLFNTVTDWAPATDGPLSAVRFAMHVNSLNVAAAGGPHLIRYRLALRQAGVIYYLTAGARLEGAGWGALADDDLPAADFTRAGDAGASTPDFSAAGEPIEFGLACGVEGISLGGGSGAFSARVDNLLVEVRHGDPPGRPRIDHIQVRICGVE